MAELPSARARAPGEAASASVGGGITASAYVTVRDPEELEPVSVTFHLPAVAAESTVMVTDTAAPGTIVFG